MVKDLLSNEKADAKKKAVVAYKHTGTSLSFISDICKFYYHVKITQEWVINVFIGIIDQQVITSLLTGCQYILANVTQLNAFSTSNLSLKIVTYLKRVI